MVIPIKAIESMTVSIPSFPLVDYSDFGSNFADESTPPPPPNLLVMIFFADKYTQVKFEVRCVTSTWVNNGVTLSALGGFVLLPPPPWNLRKDR